MSLNNDHLVTQLKKRNQRWGGLLSVSVIVTAFACMTIGRSTPVAFAWRDTTSAVTSFGGSSLDIGRGLATMSDGGFVSAGFTTSDPMSIDSLVISSASGTRSSSLDGNNRDMFLARHDANGVAVWVKAFGGPGQDYLYSVATDGQDNIYIAGVLVNSGNFPSGSVSGTTSHPFIAKFDSEGNVLWFRELPASVGNTVGAAYSVVVHPAGGVVLVGNIDGNETFGDRSGTVSTQDAFVAKYSDSGTLTWVARIRGTDKQIATDVAVGANGDVHVVGSAVNQAILEDTTGTSTTQNFGTETAFHIVLSADGVTRSATYFEASVEATGQAIAMQSDGSALIGLAVEGSISIGSRSVMSPSGQTTSVLFKRDSSGNVVWLQEFSDATFSTEPRAIVVATDGAVWMTGTLIRQPNPLQEQIYVARYLEDGTATFPSPLVFGDQVKRSIGQEFLAMPGGEVMLTGRFGGGPVNPQDPNDEIVVSGVSDVLIMKLTPNGALASATTTTTSPAAESTTVAPNITSAAETSSETRLKTSAKSSTQSLPVVGRSVNTPMALAGILIGAGVLIIAARRRLVV